MKKNILFIIPDLSSGGGEKSLINLLTQVDFKKVNVDLFILKHNGMFMKLIPKEVNLLEVTENLQIFNMNLKNSILNFLSRGEFGLAYNRLMFCIINRINKNVSIAEQCSWKYLRKVIGSIDKKYDVAIGYLEKTPNYICIDCIEADKKIGWVHTDYNKIEADKEFDKKYFDKFNYIVTVSEECKNSLISNFKDKERKIRIIENIVSPIIIKRMAKESTDIIIKEGENIIVSVGRLSYEKGFDIAINACKKLVNEDINVKWYLIGEGSERVKLEKLINENKLENNFILLGEKKNPYKYIKLADVYVQPSRFEGKSIAIDEAKILAIPIVITNFSTANDQINNNINGLVVQMNSQGVANGIIRIVNNEKLKLRLRNNLKAEKLGTESEIKKFYELIN